MSKAIGLTILVALVIWAALYFGLGWFHYQPLLSIIVAIIGALISVAVYWVITKHSVELAASVSLIGAAVGSGLFLMMFQAAITLPTDTLVTTVRTVSIWIDCATPDGPEVYSNYIGASPGDTVNFVSDRQRAYRIEFKDNRSPFPQLNYLVPINQNLSLVVNSNAVTNYYRFDVRCPDNSPSPLPLGNIPMIQIPRKY